MTDAILFDLDRTLVDLQSYTDYTAAWADIQEFLDGALDSVVPDTDWDRPTQACMAALVSLAGTPRWHEASDLIAQRELLAIPKSTPMPGLADAMVQVTGRPVAVVTLLPPHVAREALAFHGVHIDVIIGRQPDIRPKPHGDGLGAACERLGVDPAAATMIGDSTWDLAAAQAAGAAFIGVPFSPGVFAEGTPLASDLSEAVSQAVRL